MKKKTVQYMDEQYMDEVRRIGVEDGFTFQFFSESFAELRDGKISFGRFVEMVRELHYAGVIERAKCLQPNK